MTTQTESQTQTKRKNKMLSPELGGRSKAGITPFDRDVEEFAAEIFANQNEVIYKDDIYYKGQRVPMAVKSRLIYLLENSK